MYPDHPSDSDRLAQAIIESKRLLERTAQLLKEGALSVLHQRERVAREPDGDGEACED